MLTGIRKQVMPHGQLSSFSIVTRVMNLIKPLMSYANHFSDALQDAQLIDPRLNIVPSACGMSSLRAGLLSFSNPTASQRYNLYCLHCVH